MVLDSLNPNEQNDSQPQSNTGRKNSAADLAMLRHRPLRPLKRKENQWYESTSSFEHTELTQKVPYNSYTAQIEHTELTKKVPYTSGISLKRGGPQCS